MHKTFGSFINKKKRDTIHQLGLVEKLLEKQGMKVETFLEKDDDDPYIFVKNTQKNSSFEGIRIYKIGDKLAFRVQKESKTHPYGKAYLLEIEEMFQDFLTDDDMNDQKAGQLVIASVAKEIRNFFEKSVDAERDRKEDEISHDDPQGNVMVRNTGTDYSSLIYSKA